MGTVGLPFVIILNGVDFITPYHFPAFRANSTSVISFLSLVQIITYSSSKKFPLSSIPSGNAQRASHPSVANSGIGA